jgi:hypothetical protein
MQCELDPENLAGICLTCTKVLRPKIHKLPCLRYKITDTRLFREGSLAPGHEWTCPFPLPSELPASNIINSSRARVPETPRDTLQRIRRLRAAICEVRSRLQQQRSVLREKQDAKVAADNNYMTLLRLKGLLPSSESLNLRSDGRTLEELFQDCGRARAEYGSIEYEYNLLEDQLGGKEFELTRLRRWLSREMENRTPSNISATLDPVGQEIPIRSRSPFRNRPIEMDRHLSLDRYAEHSNTWKDIIEDDSLYPRSATHERILEQAQQKHGDIFSDAERWPWFVRGVVPLFYLKGNRGWCTGWCKKCIGIGNHRSIYDEYFRRILWTAGDICGQSIESAFKSKAAAFSLAI